MRKKEKKNTMTRNDFIKAVAAQAGMTQVQTKAVIEAMEIVVAENLATEGKITVMNGLTVEVREVAEATRRNPQTGESFVSPAHNTVKAKIGKALKDIVA